MESIESRFFINRELSWLDFNARVLNEAYEPDIPVLDRLKFLAISSNNLDEFFMVRVAGLKHQLYLKSTSTDPSGLTTEQQLASIRKKTDQLVKMQYQCLFNQLLPELEKHSIFILKPADLTPAETDHLSRYFNNEVFPVLTPIAIDPSHPFPILNNLTIQIAVSVKKHDSGKILRAFVEVPKVLPRFIKLRTTSRAKGSYYVLLEDAILANLDSLFSENEVLFAFPFRLTKDMDYTADEEGIRDLLVHIEKKLKHRKRRDPVRIEIPAGTNNTLKKWLLNKLDLGASSVFNIEGLLDLSSFFELISKEKSTELTEPEWDFCSSPDISEKTSVFESIKQKKYIALFHPYHAFDPVVRFIEEAAEDPSVLAIKQTLYRVSGNSPIVQALQRAAENGKQVTVIVELKARFDEEVNINWARKLEESGAHVIYGIVGLKIHCKALLVIRREDNVIRRYLHLSTGNYNDRTAKIYTDIGYFTTDPDLCNDVASLFNVMTGYSNYPKWNKIASSPKGLREKIMSLIDREARLTIPHHPGHIIIKVNSLTDPETIACLYKAAYAGVKIDLIVRGICCLKPGIDTENINVISVIDRFLEHSRIYYFANGGNPEYYVSSADLMQRNLDRRIELFFPIDDRSTQETISEILRFHLEDKIKARVLQPDGKYKSFKNKKYIQTRSQALIYNMLREESND
ncbi:MAG: polyphosphate kinase 1 [Candidatus Auribacterota bacterium]|jgi:polyphosphate kinase|uniref:Polyphosphate kinase n=1 Tax=Candidatus Auribacter fodinae TaxID=2093366 RepID=A0A3A4RCL0_9BACT|nr:MAG: polyphosphate kinase 1 [Candidatus Auribacter fodinae]